MMNVNEEDWRTENCRPHSVVRRGHWIALGLGLAIGALLGYSAHAEGVQDASACAQQQKEKLCEELAETAFDRCWGKIRRFDGTEASAESRARFLWHCGYQAGVWTRMDQ